MKTVLTLVGGFALCAALAFPQTAKANMLLNGSLETSATPDQYGLVSASTTHNTNALANWTITSGSIDVVPNTYWQSTAGTYSVDLIGSPGVGTISQTVSTIIGETYALTFDFAVNPENITYEAISTKRLAVTATSSGSVVDGMNTFSGTTGSRTLSNLLYAQQTFQFTASSTSTRISLAALMPTGLNSSFISTSVFSGPIVDNLDLEVFTGSPPESSVPEPASLSLLGIGAVALLRRRAVRRT